MKYSQTSYKIIIKNKQLQKNCLMQTIVLVNFTGMPKQMVPCNFKQMLFISCHLSVIFTLVHRLNFSCILFHNHFSLQFQCGTLNGRIQIKKAHVHKCAHIQHGQQFVPCLTKTKVIIALAAVIPIYIWAATSNYILYCYLQLPIKLQPKLQFQARHKLLAMLLKNIYSTTTRLPATTNLNVKFENLQVKLKAIVSQYLSLKVYPPVQIHTTVS